MRALFRLVSLKPGERRLLFTGMGLMPLVRIALSIWPVGRVTHFLDGLNKRFPRSSGPEIELRQAANCLRQAAQLCPLPTTCLSQAISAKMLMARYGHSAELCVGVLKSDNMLQAHAWLECPGDILVGTPVPQGKQYVRLPGAERLTE